MAKPSIVFAHGLWADGSCFSKLIPALLTEGHQVIASFVEIAHKSGHLPLGAFDRDLAKLDGVKRIR